MYVLLVKVGISFSEKLTTGAIVVVVEIVVVASVVVGFVVVLEFLSKYNDIIAVITDIIMPEMDGHELIRTIRANPKYDNIAVLANTQYGENESEEIVLEEGADDFVRKPSTPMIVKTRLANVLMHRDYMKKNRNSERG